MDKLAGVEGSRNGDSDGGSDEDKPCTRPDWAMPHVRCACRAARAHARHVALGWRLSACGHQRRHLKSVSRVSSASLQHLPRLHHSSSHLWSCKSPFQLRKYAGYLAARSAGRALAGGAARVCGLEPFY